MSIQPAGSALFLLGLPVKKLHLSETCTMGSLRSDLFGKILHCLEARDLQAMACVSRSMKNKVITEASDSEPSALINFTKRIIECLNVQRFALERGSLIRVVEDIRRDPFASLRFLKEGSILPLRNRLIGIIKRLEDETLANLEAQVKPDKFMGNVFTLAHHQSAIEEASRIEDESNRERTLLNLSKDLLAISRKLIGSRKFDEAIDIAKLIPDTRNKQDAYRDISIDLTGAGNFDGAIDIARLIVSEGSYFSEFIACEPFKRIFYSLIEVKNFSKAASVAMMISDSQLRSDACIDLCRHLKGAKDFESALDVAGEISPRWMRNDMISEIAMAIAADGNVDRAIHIIKFYFGSDIDIWVPFSRMSNMLADIQNFDKATELAISHLDGDRREYAVKYISRYLS